MKNILIMIVGFLTMTLLVGFVGYNNVTAFDTGYGGHFVVNIKVVTIDGHDYIVTVATPKTGTGNVSISTIHHVGCKRCCQNIVK